MLRSMTGYGESEVSGAQYTVKCEIRSINGRFLTFSIKLPESLQYLEFEIRKAVKAKLRRGTVYITIKIDEAVPESYRLNMDAIGHYTSILEKIKEETGISKEPDPGIFFSLPGVIENVEPEPSSETRETVLTSIEKAMGQLLKMRVEEGKNLTKDLRERLNKIEDYVGRIEKRSVQSIEERRRRLKERIEEFLTEYDKERLNLEVLTQIEKYDIKEELVRLKSHLSHFKKGFDEPPPVGSKLIYLTQEMQREANTLAVKSMDASISLDIVLIKEELERIREQLQNVE